jgi:prephenate dehydrogenase
VKSSHRFEQLTVIGLGLLGGSVARAARERGVARKVVGVSRSRETAAAALDGGTVDESQLDVVAGAAGADLLVLATPVSAMSEVLRAAASSLEEGAIVTDVGSVKGHLAETLPGLLPPGVHYVGSHPMAGGHHSGLAHARADLLEGAPCVLTPGPSTPGWVADRVEGFWSDLGAVVMRRTPVNHDAEVAWVSHVPHAVAFAFARAFADAPDGATAVQGAGFHDFTRIAASDPELWADILVHNRKALGGPLANAAERTLELARLIEAGDAEAVERFLAAARDVLARGANDARSGGENPEIPVVRRSSTIKE